MEPQNKVQRLVRVSETAEQLSLSRSKIYQMMDTGELAYVKFGKARRIPVEEIDRLVLRNTIGK